jgi:hypothetical protein
MEKKQMQRDRSEARREEFAVGFFAGLAIVGGLALILLAIFWVV